jgi:hypothetical protein
MSCFAFPFRFMNLQLSRIAMLPSMSTHKIFTRWVTLSVLVIGGLISAAEEEPKSASDQAPKTTKISGVIEAIVSHEISTSTKQIDAFEINRIIPHGATVREGQNLVWFETEAIDKKIKDAETDLRLAKLILDDEEFAHKQFLDTQALDRETAERTRAYAKQDYDNFVQVDRERDVLAADFSLRMSRYSLEGVMEELDQLEQMYQEDDLTEVSEEIVLKRAKRDVESARYRLENAEIATNRTVTQSIPRLEKQQEDKLAKAELAYEKSIRDLNSARQRREIEIHRKRDSFQEQEKKFAELKGERKQVVLKSPIDGIVFYGELNRGRLSEKPSTLKPASKVSGNQVVVTVIDPSKVQIRVDLDEKHLAKVREGAKCKVTLTAFADFETTGTVKSVSSVPYGGTKYDCVVKLHQTKNQPNIRPTMTCELEFDSIVETPQEGSGGDDAKEKK